MSDINQERSKQQKTTLMNSKKATFTPEVTTTEKDQIKIRGESIECLIKHHSFAAIVFLLFEGRLPDEREEAMIQAVLVSLVDHGRMTPSIDASHAVHSGGNPLHVSVAAGVLAFGETYGGAIEQAARLFHDANSRPGSPDAIAKEIVGLYAGQKANLPGYGHSLHTTDPRTNALMQKARELEVYDRYCAIAEAVQKVLEDRYKEKYPLNVGGAAAAIICELGCDYRMARALYILSRTTGTIAHAIDAVRELQMDETPAPLDREDLLP